MRLRHAITAAALLTLQVLTAATAGDCAPSNQQADAVREALLQFYAALRTENDRTWLEATTVTFNAYDAGARFDRESLFALIKAAHADGKTYDWNVTDLVTRIDCGLAFAFYVTRGSVTDALGATPVTWLESAALRYLRGRWRVEFLHSSRLATK